MGRDGPLVAWKGDASIHTKKKSRRASRQTLALH
jgi:hypothetical protein